MPRLRNEYRLQLGRPTPGGPRCYAEGVFNVGGDVSVAREGRVAVAIRSDHDYTSVQAAGDLVLDGQLTLDVQGALTPGTVLTIMRGKSIEGNFHALPEKRVVNTGGYLERDADRDARGAGNAVNSR